MEDIKHLLRDSDLPTEGLEAHLSHFILADEGGAIRGVSGLEPYPPVGLLRSVAVEASRRGSGVGRELCGELLLKAHEWGVREVYLLTTTAGPFFEKLGFREIDRTAAPESIHQTEEFSTLCPASATCMMKTV